MIQIRSDGTVVLTDAHAKAIVRWREASYRLKEAEAETHRLDEARKVADKAYWEQTALEEKYRDEVAAAYREFQQVQR